LSSGCETDSAGTPKSGLLLAINNLPFTTLMGQGKLARDGRDLRLLDGAGTVPGILTTVMDCPRGSVVFLNNATYSAKPPEDRPAPTVTVRVTVADTVTSVESAKYGKLQYQLKDGELTVTLPVPNADIVMIRK